MPFKLQVNPDDQAQAIDIVEYAPPAPGAFDVQIRISAVALNYRDYALMQGTSFGSASGRYVPFSDGCGIVEKIGADVTMWEVGDRVCPLFFPNWPAGRPTASNRRALGSGGTMGVGQQVFTISEQALIAPPPALSDKEAATLPCAGLTAWNAVMGAGLAPGDVVLLQGTGGVSLFALQFAQAAGLRAIVTSSSDEKLEKVKSMGASATINYRTSPNWAEEAVKLNNDQGVDLVVEVGGAGTFSQSLDAIRPGGHISVVGMLAGGEQSIDIRKIYGKNARLRGITVGSREDFEAMNRAISFHGLRPAVGQIIPWRDADKAVAQLAKGGGLGKIVLDFQSD